MNNAELRRNFRLELAPAKMIISPSVIGIITLLVYAAQPQPQAFFSALNTVSGVLLSFILLLWAMKLAAESVITEVNERTWMFQRMSSVSALDMTVGKLFGSTVYAWYTAGFCLFAFVVSALKLPDGVVRLKFGLVIILAALVGHALSILLSLVVVKNARFTGNTGKNSVFLAGVIIAMFVLSITSSVFVKGADAVRWMSFTVERVDFFIMSGVYAAFWSIAGLYRMMRQELQYDNTPSYWCVFVATLLVYMNGLTLGLPDGEGGLEGNMVLWTTFPLLVILTYLTLIIESFDPVAIRKLIDRVRRRRWKEAAVFVPIWMPTLAGVFVAAFFLLAGQLIGGESAFHPSGEYFRLGVLPLAVVLFLLRDLGVIALLKSTGSRKGDFYIAIYFTVIYVLVPAVCTLTKMNAALHFFWPVPKDSLLLQVIPAAVECAAVGYLVKQRRGLLFRQG